MTPLASEAGVPVALSIKQRFSCLTRVKRFGWKYLKIICEEAANGESGTRAGSNGYSASNSLSTVTKVSG